MALLSDDSWNRFQNLKESRLGKSDSRNVSGIVKRIEFRKTLFEVFLKIVVVWNSWD
jgi:hypothetical protein